MTDDEELFAFVRENLRTVWTLELLLVLRREPDRAWTVDALVSELRGSQVLVTNSLHALQTAGLTCLSDTGDYAYRPASPALDRLARGIERAYRVRPVTVIKWITAPPDHLRRLANAFKFKAKDT